MKKIVCAFLCVFLLIFTVGCNKKDQNKTDDENLVIQENITDPNYPITVRGVVIDQLPTKIVSFSPAITEIMGELGLENYLVGRTPYCDYSVYVENLTVVGTPLVPDIEKLLPLMPEFIFSQSPLSDEFMDTISGMGTKIVVFPKGKDIDEILDIYRDIFLICKGKESGLRAAEEFNENFMVEYTNALIDGMSSSTRIDAVYLAGEMNLATPDTFEGSIMLAMGLNNLAQGENWDNTASNLNPKLIIVASGSGINRRDIENSDDFDGSDAVDDENYILINHIPIERQSPRMIREIKSVVSQIYAK